MNEQLEIPLDGQTSKVITDTPIATTAIAPKPEPKPNSIEGYQNSIELLKRTLQFYALKENYMVSHPINNQLFSFVEMDGGTQARFTLDKLREIEELNEKMEKDYNAEIDALQNMNDDEILNTFLMETFNE